MNQNIFREYDIRGIVGPDLNGETVALLARAIGTFFAQNNARHIALGFDARESSPLFRDLLVKGLNDSGCDVLDIGRVPTPVLYFAVFTKDVDGGVMITGWLIATDGSTALLLTIHVRSVLSSDDWPAVSRVKT